MKKRDDIISRVNAGSKGGSSESQDADFTAKTIADKQADTNQEQAKTEDAKRHDKEQV